MVLKKKQPASAAANANPAHDASLWVRNIQLYIFSLPQSFLVLLLEPEGLTDVFRGFTTAVWVQAAWNALGGLLVAIVIKYADNILKGYSNAMAIIMTSIVTITLFGKALDLSFVSGLALVVTSIWLYGFAGKKG